MHLNYHHLRYFWAVAKEGHLTRAARQLRVSQSALSSQIRQLEDQLGQPLFLRQGRKLELSEAGRVALAYAEQIFSAGSELVSVLGEGTPARRPVLRIGSVATLSRNFQDAFLAPALAEPRLSLVLQSASLRELLTRLSAHALDVVLSNQAVQGDAENALKCERVARQSVSIVGKPRRRRFRFPQDLAHTPLLLPSKASDMRHAFDLLCSELAVPIEIRAEVDDMALLRLLARDADGVAVVPSIVVRDELEAGVLTTYCTVPGVFEDFYAISLSRRYENPWTRRLIEHARKARWLGTPARAVRSRPR